MYGPMRSRKRALRSEMLKMNPPRVRGELLIDPSSRATDSQALILFHLIYIKDFSFFLDCFVANEKSAFGYVFPTGPVKPRACPTLKKIRMRVINEI
jgi:hypothetical protein